MEAIDTRAIKDSVSVNNGYRNWNHFLDVLSCGEPIEEAQESVFNEVIIEVAKQVAEAKNKICYDIVADGTPKELLDGTLKLRINLSKDPNII